MSSVSLERALRVQCDSETLSSGEQQKYYFATGMEIMSQTHGVKFMFQCKFQSNTIRSLRFHIEVETKVIQNNKIETRWEPVAENILEGNGLRFTRRFALLWSTLCEEKNNQYGVGVSTHPADSSQARIWPNLSVADVSWLCHTNGNFERELLNCGVPVPIAKRCSSKNAAHSKKRTKSTWLLGAYWRSSDCQEKLKDLYQIQNYSRCVHCSGSTSVAEGTKLAWKSVPGFPYTLRLFATTVVEYPGAGAPGAASNALPAELQGEVGGTSAPDPRAVGNLVGAASAPSVPPKEPIPGIRPVNLHKLVPLLLEPMSDTADFGATLMTDNLILCQRCAAMNSELNEKIRGLPSLQVADAESLEDEEAANAGSSSPNQLAPITQLIDALRKEQTRRPLRLPNPAGALASSGPGLSNVGHAGFAGSYGIDQPMPSEPSREEVLAKDLLNAQVTIVLDELNRAVRHHLRHYVSNSRQRTEFQHLAYLCSDGKIENENPVVNSILYVLSRFLQDYQVSNWSKIWQHKAAEHFRTTGSRIPVPTSTEDISAVAGQQCNSLWFFLMSLTIARRQNAELKRLLSPGENKAYLNSRSTKRIYMLSLLQQDGASAPPIANAGMEYVGNNLGPSQFRQPYDVAAMNSHESQPGTSRYPVPSVPNSLAAPLPENEGGGGSSEALKRKSPPGAIGDTNE